MGQMKKYLLSRVYDDMGELNEDAIMVLIEDAYDIEPDEGWVGE